MGWIEHKLIVVVSMWSVHSWDIWYVDIQSVVWIFERELPPNLGFLRLQGLLISAFPRVCDSGWNSYLLTLDEVVDECACKLECPLRNFVLFYDVLRHLLVPHMVLHNLKDLFDHDPLQVSQISTSSALVVRWLVGGPARIEPKFGLILSVDPY